MAKYIVCIECEGEGYVSSLGAFSASELDAEYGDDWAAREDFVAAYSQPGGVYTRACDLCRGARVVTPAEAADWADLIDYRAEADTVARYESVGY